MKRDAVQGPLQAEKAQLHKRRHGLPRCLRNVTYRHVTYGIHARMWYEVRHVAGVCPLRRGAQRNPHFPPSPSPNTGKVSNGILTAAIMPKLDVDTRDRGKGGRGEEEDAEGCAQGEWG